MDKKEFIEKINSIEVFKAYNIHDQWENLKDEYYYELKDEKESEDEQSDLYYDWRNLAEQKLENELNVLSEFGHYKILDPLYECEDRISCIVEFPKLNYIIRSDGWDSSYGDSNLGDWYLVTKQTKIVEFYGPDPEIEE